MKEDVDEEFGSLKLAVLLCEYICSQNMQFKPDLQLIAKLVTGDKALESALESVYQKLHLVTARNTLDI